MTNTARLDDTAEHDASMEAISRHLYGDGDMDEERERIALAVATLDGADVRQEIRGQVQQALEETVLTIAKQIDPEHRIEATELLNASLLALARQQHDRIAALEAEVARLKQQAQDDTSTRDAAEDLTSAYLAGVASQKSLIAALEAQRDAAEECGAKRMRERAASMFDALAGALEPIRGRDVASVRLQGLVGLHYELAKAIRALPLRDTPAPDSSGEG